MEFIFKKSIGIDGIKDAPHTHRKVSGWNWGYRAKSQKEPALRRRNHQWIYLYQENRISFLRVTRDGLV